METIYFISGTLIGFGVAMKFWLFERGWRKDISKYREEDIKDKEFWYQMYNNIKNNNYGK